MKDIPENCWKCEYMDGTFDMWFCDKTEEYITAPYMRPKWCPKEGEEREEERDAD